MDPLDEGPARRRGVCRDMFRLEVRTLREEAQIHGLDAEHADQPQRIVVG